MLKDTFVEYFVANLYFRFSIEIESSLHSCEIQASLNHYDICLIGNAIALCHSRVTLYQLFLDATEEESFCGHVY